MDAMKLSEIAALVGGRLKGDANPVISGAASLEEATASDLTFVIRPNLLPRLADSAAGAVILAPGMSTDKPAIELDNPYAGFSLFLRRFEAPVDRIFPPEVHPSAVIHPSAQLGADVRVGPFCVLGPDVRLGDGCRLGAHVVLSADVTLGQECCLYSDVSVREGCRLGDRVILHSGVRIGTDGFGFLPGPQGLTKIPQVGIAVIEDDVEIGSNSCVDRATTGLTVVGRGTKLDNMVQVGHNVRIGNHCVISGHTGIAGSCTIGHGVAIGGFVGIGDHRKVGDGAKIGPSPASPGTCPPGPRSSGHRPSTFKNPSGCSPPCGNCRTCCAGCAFWRRRTSPGITRSRCGDLAAENRR